jgi:hypothetical protein
LAPLIRFWMHNDAPVFLMVSLKAYRRRLATEEKPA